MPSIPLHLRERAETWADRPALRWAEGDGRRQITYRDLHERVERFSRGLAALGVRPGDRVYVHADNSWRWIVADLAILRAGAVSVPRGADTTPDEAEYIIGHSGSNVIVAGSPRDFETLPRPEGELHARVVLTGEHEDAASFEEVLDRGRDAPEVEGTDDDLATIVYTSGTTGTPKGVMLTHANILHNVRVMPPLLDVNDDDLFLSVLPSWHMFERTVEYIVLASGATLSYSSLRTLKQDMLDEKPTFLAAVPRLFEGVEAGFRAKLEKKKPFARKLAKFLLARAVNWGTARRRLAREIENPLGDERSSRLGAAAGVVLGAPLGLLGRKIVGGPVKAAVGGRLRGAVSGGGMLSTHLDTFLDSLGLPIYVGYGLTETSPVVTIRYPGANTLGTIGRAVPETEIRVVDEGGRPLPLRTTGELEVKGPQVMRGYYENPEATKTVLSEDGWFRTGDLVRRTEKGDLIFTGRKKETIVLAGGENIEPSPIEGRILESPFVRQAMVVGQDRKALAALLVPEKELAAAEAKTRGIEVKDLLREEVLRLVNVRTGFKPRETVGRIAVMDEEFSVEEGTLTRTLKLRRNEILRKYADVIDGLYR